MEYVTQSGKVKDNNMAASHIDLDPYACYWQLNI